MNSQAVLTVMVGEEAGMGSVLLLQHVRLLGLGMVDHRRLVRPASWECMPALTAAFLA